MAKQKAPADVSEVEPVPADRAGGGNAEKAPPPPFGTPVPAGPGGVPRVVAELSRVEAGSGLARYKIACRNYGDQPTLYVLAADEDSARACYLADTGLDKTVARLKKIAGAKADEVEAPALAVTALTD